MADERDDDLDIDEGDSGLLAFKAEMAVTEFLYKYRVPLITVLVAVPLSLLAYGQWRNLYVEGQRSTTGAIADVEASLPQDMLRLAQDRADGRAGDIDLVKVEGAADDLVAIAKGASGTSAIEAWLKAAELYRLSGNAEQQRSSLAAAAELADGVLRYAAVGALANLDLEQDKPEEALERFRSLQKEPDFLARQATLDLAGALESLDRDAEAATALDEYLTRWPDAADADDVRRRREKLLATKAG